MRRFITCTLIACSFLASCSTVDTNGRDPTSVEAGLTYFLPIKYAKFGATRSVLDAPEIQAAIAKAEEKKKLLETRVNETKSAAEHEKRVVEALKPNTPEHAAASEKLARADAEAVLAAGDLAAINSTLAGLKEQLRQAQLGAGGCVYSYSAKLELLPAVADPIHRLVLIPRHSGLRDDELKVAVQANGLLTSTNVVASDRTGDVLIELAGAIAGVPKSRSLTPFNVTERTSRPAKGCDSGLRSFQKIFDPAVESQVSALNAELSDDQFPFRLTSVGLAVHIETNTPETPSIASATLKQNGANKTDAPVSKESRGEQGESDKSDKQVGADTKASREFVSRDDLQKSGAIFYRTPSPFVVTIRQCSDGVVCVGTASDPSNSQPVDAALLMLPQGGPISYVPMRSSAFVKTVSDVQFEDGSIKSWSSTRPSEVLEVVRLPVKVLKAVLEVPATLFSLKIDLSSKAKGLADAQSVQIEAAERLRILRDCVESNAKESNDAVLSCFAE